MSTKDRSTHRYVSSKGRSYIKNYDPGTFLLLGKDLVESRTRSGVALPNWYDIIGRGDNATTALTAVFQEASSERFNDWARSSYNANPNLTFEAECSGDVYFRNNVKDATFFPGSDTNEKLFVDNLAYADFYKTLRQTQTQFHGATFVAELGEALHMLRRPFEGLQKLAGGYISALSKRKRAKPTKWLKEIGDAWLEQSFGWKPLLADISDANKAWHRLTQPDQGGTYSTGVKKDFDGMSSLASQDRPGFSARYVNGCVYDTVFAMLRRTYKVRYKFHVKARVEAPQWTTPQLFGFTPEEWIPTAWEILPWSFLADYFTNIGDILDASVTSTRDVSWINRTYVFSSEYHRVMKHNPKVSASQGAGWTYVGGSDSQYAMYTKHKTVNRSAVESVPMPSLQFNFNLSDGQLGNIAALLAGANSLYPQSKPTPWNRYINRGRIR